MKKGKCNRRIKIRREDNGNMKRKRDNVNMHKNEERKEGKRNMKKGKYRRVKI